MKRMMLLALALMVLGLGYGCLEDIEEVPLDLETEGIPAPNDLAAQVDDGLILLTWREAAGASSYHLYRRTSEEQRPARLAETVDTFYIDSNVRSGRSYYYSVSAAGADGVEGDRSEEIEAVPTAYSIIINDGEEYTGSRAVTLQLSAPVTTALMMIANDPTFTGGAWETYRFNRVWTLTEEDGVKTVYARFRDENGAESPVMSDAIGLDTHAEITGVSLSPQPYRYSPGATVQLVMHVDDNESSGEAWIMVESYDTPIYLADDGRGGDETSSDGVYGTDFTFPTGVRGTDLTLAGFFIDRAGNEAPIYETDYTVSLTDPPDPVTLIGVQDSTVASITIRWIASTEEHFAYYAIYRDKETGVSDDPALLVQKLYNIDQTAYPDGGLDEGETYFYKIYVVNDLDESAGSDELAAQTHDAYPTPVTLDELSSVGNNRVTLTWSVNGNTDFQEYRIYRETAPGVTTQSTLVETINDREVTYYDDTGLDLGSFNYYYRVYVFDKGGKLSRSNEVTTVQ